MNMLSENNIPEEAVSAVPTGSRGPEIAGVWVPILSSASLSDCTCWPSSELTSSGNTQSSWGLCEPKYDCSSSASSGPTSTPAAQYGVWGDPWNWRPAARTPGSTPQNDDDGLTGTTIPVTTMVTGVTTPVDASSVPGITNSEPACRPSVAAVCLVMTTWSVAAGCLPPGLPVPAAGEGTGVATGRCPLSSRTCGLSGCRSVISILTGVPPVPGSSSLMTLNGNVIDDQSVPAGVRLTGARSKSACS